jgi:CelD/BcsL family acetyltransferase involved in cellulose biosynthesis
VIEACIGEGLSTYDFLGTHTEHKRRWLAQPRRGHDLVVANRTATGAGLHALGVWPTGRYLRPVTIEPLRPTA